MKYLSLFVLFLASCHGVYDPRDISVSESVPANARILATKPDGRDVSGYSVGKNYLNAPKPINPIQATEIADHKKVTSSLQKQQIPVARKSDTRGFVISPWAPNAKIDVRGIQPGSVVLDPVSKQVFRIPKDFLYVPQPYLVPKTY